MSDNPTFARELPKPVPVASQPAGFMAALDLLSNKDADLEKVRSQAVQILSDPVRLQELTEQVYQMMRADLQLQKERQRGYGGWF